LDKKKAKTKSKSKLKPARPQKYTEEMLKKLGEEIVEFAQKPNVYHLCEFTSFKGYTYDWWKKLNKNHPILVPYHNRAREILGNKIVKLAFQNGNNWIIQTFVPRYLKDIDEHLDKKEDKKVERQLRIEKYRSELGLQSVEKLEAKADQLDKSIELMQVASELRDQNEKLIQLLKENGIDI